MANSRFRLSWKWAGEQAELQSRCTDELGQVQPTRAQFRKFWGQDERSESGEGIGHVNIIQPWTVTPDGSVLNGLA
jgi:sulfane dehydrogenase subunit SoxC